jgi:hypothetical protein
MADRRWKMRSRAKDKLGPEDTFVRRIHGRALRTAEGFSKVLVILSHSPSSELTWTMRVSHVLLVAFLVENLTPDLKTRSLVFTVKTFVLRFNFRPIWRRDSV